MMTVFSPTVELCSVEEGLQLVALVSNFAQENFKLLHEQSS